MEDGNVAVLVDAKEEYTKQLISILKSCIYQGIKSIYMDAKDICHQDNSPDNVLMVFQDLLGRIPKWSQDIITKEYDRISSVSKCDYIDDLLKVVYVTHIKVLTIVHSAQRNKKISIKVPSGSHFIHLCYIECAREFWKDPYLFSDRVSKYEHQNNMRTSENMISECIAETIRKQLPVRHILKEFLNEPDEEIEEEDEDIKDPINKKYLKKLETVVKKELKTSNKGIELDMDLIRKVIREEMDSRTSSSSGVISETSIIKKELVDTVVEKIVEQSNIEPAKIEDIAPINNSNVQTNILKSIIDTSSILVNDTTDNTNINATTTDATTDTITIDNNITDNTDTITIDNTTTDTTKLPSDNELNNESNNETNNESLDNLLNEQDFKEVSDVNPQKNAEHNNNIIDIKTNSVKDEITIENKGFKGAEAPLVINDIDEINLNLDELDSDLGGDIDLDSLQTVDLKPKGNEVKKDPNTKYIFFKDV
jgi:hypothetical protein